jgi:hypothetical protein
MKSKKILIFFLTIICFVLMVNIVSFLNDIPGSVYGIYLNVFNITSLLIETVLFYILNKVPDNKES